MYTCKTESLYLLYNKGWHNTVNQLYFNKKNILIYPQNIFYQIWSLCSSPIQCSVLILKCSVVSDSATPGIAALQASLSITNSQSSPKLMSIESVMSSSHLILCHPLLLLPPIPPSIRVFSSESTLRMRWPKEFQLQPQSFQ